MAPANRHKHVRDAARLREALRRFLRESDRLTRAHGLTTQRYELLLVVTTARDGSGRASLAEIAERLSLAQSSATELVNRAEDLGLVRRELSRENRRAVYVAATAEGERRVAAAARALRAERRRLISFVAEIG